MRLGGEHIWERGSRGRNEASSNSWVHKQKITRNRRKNRRGRCKLILTKGNMKTAALSRIKETRKKRNMKRAEREERSTVMRSQMLLISCVAVRVPAIATMSHSTSKQRELPYKPIAGAWHLPSFTSILQRETSHENVLPNKSFYANPAYRCIY